MLASCHRLPRVALDGGLDKLGHFLMLGALSLFAVGFFGAARWLRVALVLGLLSALEEASQAWFPARTLDALDWRRTCSASCWGLTPPPTSRDARRVMLAARSGSGHATNSRTCR